LIVKIPDDAIGSRNKIGFEVNRVTLAWLAGIFETEEVVYYEIR
jgi:hypothetical protein